MSTKDLKRILNECLPKQISNSKPCERLEKNPDNRKYSDYQEINTMSYLKPECLDPISIIYKKHLRERLMVEKKEKTCSCKPKVNENKSLLRINEINCALEMNLNKYI